MSAKVLPVHPHRRDSDYPLNTQANLLLRSLKLELQK
jgi:hypothetical protein